MYFTIFHDESSKPFDMQRHIFFAKEMINVQQPQFLIEFSR